MSLSQAQLFLSNSMAHCAACHILKPPRGLPHFAGVSQRDQPLPHFGFLQSRIGGIASIGSADRSCFFFMFSGVPVLANSASVQPKEQTNRKLDQIKPRNGKTVGPKKTFETEKLKRNGSIQAEQVSAFQAELKLGDFGWAAIAPPPGEGKLQKPPPTGLSRVHISHARRLGS